MRCFLRAVCLAGLSSVMLVAGNPASAQKPGGIMRVYLTASPPNMSVLELPTIVGEMPMMGVFNNLIMFDQADTVDRDGLYPQSYNQHIYQHDPC